MASSMRVRLFRSIDPTICRKMRSVEINLPFLCMFRLYKGAPPFGVVVNASFHYNTKISEIRVSIEGVKNLCPIFNICVQVRFTVSKFALLVRSRD